MGGKARSPDAALAVYRSMRRFDVTPEPSGGPRRRDGGPLSYVVQKHAASRLHYDFRLELDDVLLSWSIPKGPSLVVGQRRLAVRTEDHPMEYADFEGIIPKGQYGGGTVLVWDQGHWLPEGDAREALERGRLTFALLGEKLRGAFHLVRTGMDGKHENWLLMKRRDDSAREGGEIVDDEPRSVLSGRTIEEIAAAPDRVWHSDRADDAAPAPRPARTPARRPAARKPRAASGAPPADVKQLLVGLAGGVPLTNLDKVLYPESGLTKGAFIAYLAAVADWILPHLGGRPLTLVRCPDGRDKFCFFQKHAKPGMPRSIGRVKIEEDDGVAEYLRVDDLAGLLAVGQLGALELHTWGSRADDVEHPDLLVFDLDPDPAIGWARVVEAAFELRDDLGELGLTTFVKTTGGKGLHVVAPVDPGHSWEAHKAFSQRVVEAIAARAPGRYVTTMAKARRRGKIFLDYLRNGRGATFIAPYSPRAREGATVATPVGWDELAAGVDPRELTIETVPRRLGGLARDPWGEISRVRQTFAERRPARARARAEEVG